MKNSTKKLDEFKKMYNSFLSDLRKFKDESSNLSLERNKMDREIGDIKKLRTEASINGDFNKVDQYYTEIVKLKEKQEKITNEIEKIKETRAEKFSVKLEGVLSNYQSDEIFNEITQRLKPIRDRYKELHFELKELEKEHSRITEEYRDISHQLQRHVISIIPNETRRKDSIGKYSTSIAIRHLHEFKN